MPENDANGIAICHWPSCKPLESTASCPNVTREALGIFALLGFMGNTCAGQSKQNLKPHLAEVVVAHMHGSNSRQLMSWPSPLAEKDSVAYEAVGWSCPRECTQLAHS